MESMEEESRSILLAAVRLALRPMIRILIRGGIPFREFSELAKFAYVESAAQEFAGRDRALNV